MLNTNVNVNLYVGSTQYFTVTVMSVNPDTDAETAVNNATVSLSILDETRASVTTITCSYVAASSGVYRGTKPYSTTLTAGKTYYVRGTAINSSGGDPQTLFDVAVVATYAPTT
jgi:hypothetical protein